MVFSHEFAIITVQEAKSLINGINLLTEDDPNNLPNCHVISDVGLLSIYQKLKDLVKLNKQYEDHLKYVGKEED